MELPEKIMFPQWVEDNAASLKPPVGNKPVWDVGDDFVVMAVGGPNQRTDFHVDPYEEYFHQIKGTLEIDIMTKEGPEKICLGEGDMSLLPRMVPHSPQRSPGSLGLVIERIRQPGTTEKFQWYCQQCSNLLYEVDLDIRDMVVDLPPVFEGFYADQTARTCHRCGLFHPGKG